MTVRTSFHNTSISWRVSLTRRTYHLTSLAKRRKMYGRVYSAKTLGIEASWQNFFISSPPNVWTSRISWKVVKLMFFFSCTSLTPWVARTAIYGCLQSSHSPLVTYQFLLIRAIYVVCNHCPNLHFADAMTSLYGTLLQNVLTFHLSGWLRGKESGIWISVPSYNNAESICDWKTFKVTSDRRLRRKTIQQSGW